LVNFLQSFEKETKVKMLVKCVAVLLAISSLAAASSLEKSARKDVTNQEAATNCINSIPSCFPGVNLDHIPSDEEVCSKWYGGKQCVANALQTEFCKQVLDSEDYSFLRNVGTTMDNACQNVQSKGLSGKKEDAGLQCLVDAAKCFGYNLRKKRQLGESDEQYCADWKKDEQCAVEVFSQKKCQDALADETEITMLLSGIQNLFNFICQNPEDKNENSEVRKLQLKSIKLEGK